MLEKLFTKKIVWTIAREYKDTPLAEQLTDFDKVYSLGTQQQQVAWSPLSQVYKIAILENNYFLKRYNISRKLMQRYLGQSKVKREWKNLLWFRELGIPVANVIAYGQETQGWITMRGILLTEELKDAVDLAHLAETHSPLLDNKVWVQQVSHQLASVTRKLHENNFAHNDLKWRNIMIDIKAEFPQIYLIDCPSGMKWPYPFLTYRIIKDLACIDKRGKYNLSRTQRMAFYKDYAQCNKLTLEHKKQIRKILTFFHNRE